MAFASHHKGNYSYYLVGIKKLKHFSGRDLSPVLFYFQYPLLFLSFSYLPHYYLLGPYFVAVAER